MLIQAYMCVLQTVDCITYNIAARHNFYFRHLPAHGSNICCLTSVTFEEWQNFQYNSCTTKHKMYHSRDRAKQHSVDNCINTLPLNEIRLATSDTTSRIVTLHLSYYHYSISRSRWLGGLRRRSAAVDCWECRFESL